MSLEKTIEDLAGKCIDNERLFIVGVSVKGNPNNQKIQVFVDGDEGVKIDECSAISRKLSDLLEEKDIIEGRYVIEVSSPGADKPLKMIRQYPQHIGRELEIVTREKKKYRGILKSVVKNEIVLITKKQKKEEENTFDLGEIETARVLIKF